MGKDAKAKTPLAPPMPIDWTLSAKEIAGKAKVPLDFRPSAPELEKLASFLKIEAIAAWRIKGNLLPEKREGWRLDARMTADLTQACGITLDPVRQRIDERFVRKLVPEQDEPEHEVIEASGLDLDADDEPDTFGEVIDLGALAIEALALALDPYPVSDNPASDHLVAAPPGVEPLTDETVKPFAGLAELKARLESSDGS